MPPRSLRLWPDLDEIVAALGGECDLETSASYTWAEEAQTLEKVHAEVEAATAAGLSVEFVTEIGLPFDVLACQAGRSAAVPPGSFCRGGGRGSRRTGRGCA